MSSGQVGGLVEMAQASREELGNRHPNTLISISNLGQLLQDQGDLEGAAALLRHEHHARSQPRVDSSTRREPSQ